MVLELDQSPRTLYTPHRGRTDDVACAVAIAFRQRRPVVGFMLAERVEPEDALHQLEGAVEALKNQKDQVQDVLQQAHYLLSRVGIPTMGGDAQGQVVS